MRSKKAVLNVFSSLMLQIVILLSGFIVRKIIIQIYGSDVNGLISSITQFLGYITLLESGIGPVIKAALYKPISKKNSQEINNILFATEKFFKKIAYIFTIYLILLSFVYPLIVNNQVGYWYTFSLIIIISISTFAEYYFGMTYKLFLQADQNSYIVSVIQIASYILNLVMVIVLAKLNCSIHVLKLVTAFIYVLRPVIQNIIVRKKYKINLKEVNHDYVLKQKWDGLAQHIASVIHTNTDITILTFVSTLKEVSVYSVYSTVTNGLRLIVQSFNEGIEAMFGDMLANSEKENLKDKFGIYEVMFFSIMAILYSCALVLITPFVKVYTLNISDLDYCRPVFGYLLVMGEIIWAIRQPYNSLIKSAGHFKQTRIGAWIEAGVNIVLSIILVYKYGIVGVAIGTFVAMIVRTVEFIYYSNKYILERGIIESIKKIVTLIIIITISSGTFIFLKSGECTTYISWIINAIIVLAYSISVTLCCNIVIYRKEMKEIVSKVKKK